MASRLKKSFQNFNLARLGRRDRQVTPVEDGGRLVQGQANETRQSNLKTVSKQVDDKRLERIKKEETDRLKNIERDYKLRKRALRKQVRKDLASTSLETCATFCFILVVGSTLLGGGTALIVSGKENNIFDFIVVGAAGLTIGIIFTVAGVILICKPVYEKHIERKAKEKKWGNLNSQPKDQTAHYIDEAQRNVLTSQIYDSMVQKRRPSNADLYGDESFDAPPPVPTLRDESFHSYVEPPLLAVPNDEKHTLNKKPVLMLDAKESIPTTEKNTKKQNTQRIDTLMGLAAEKDDKIKCKTEDAMISLPTQSNKDNDIVEIDNIIRHASKSTIVIEHFHSDLDSPVEKDTSTNMDDSETPRQIQSFNLDDTETSPRIQLERDVSEGTIIPVDDSSSEMDTPRPERYRLCDFGSDV